MKLTEDTRRSWTGWPTAATGHRSSEASSAIVRRDGDLVARRTSPRCSTTEPPTKNTPMMSSDRKMVTMEPSAVERLRVKPVSDSLKKVKETRHRSRTPLDLGRASGAPRSSAMTRRRMLSTISRSCVATTHGGAGAVDALKQVHDAARRLRVQVARRLVADERPEDGSRWRAQWTRAAARRRKAGPGRLFSLSCRPTRRSTSGTCVLMTWRALADYLKCERNVLEHRLVRQQLEVLEHAADVAAQVRHAPIAHGGQDPHRPRRCGPTWASPRG